MRGDKGFNVALAICDQANRGAGVEWRTSAVDVMKMWPAAHEQDRVCVTPNAFVKHGSLGASRNQRNPISVLSHLPEPLYRLSTEWRIAPHASDPRLYKPIVLDCVVAPRRLPRPGDWRARVQIKFSECAQHFRRREPLVVLHHGRLVRAKCHVSNRAPYGPHRALVDKRRPVRLPLGRTSSVRSSSIQAPHARLPRKTGVAVEHKTDPQPQLS